MQEILSEKQSINTDYYQSNHAQFYQMARMRQQQDVLNRMQQTYEIYSSANVQSGLDNQLDTKSESKTQTSEFSESNSKGSPSDLNLGNIASILGGNADFSKILLNALSGKNKDLANILKIINNPLVKNSLSKKNKNIPAKSSGDEIVSSNEIDKLEKIDDN